MGRWGAGDSRSGAAGAGGRGNRRARAGGRCATTPDQAPPRKGSAAGLVFHSPSRFFLLSGMLGLIDRANVVA
eukprot:976211-Rhodomonas_salina.3